MSEADSFALQQLDSVACMMRQCNVLLKNKTVICNVFFTSYHAVVKYLFGSEVDFPSSMKRTPIIDMMPNIMADMVNADCVHNRWLDALCLIILVLF